MNDREAMISEHLAELEHLHHELELVLDWDAEFLKKDDDPTFGLLVRRMAAVEWAMSLAAVPRFPPGFEDWDSPEDAEYDHV